jgi:hypothetical protein
MRCLLHYGYSDDSGSQTSDICANKIPPGRCISAHGLIRFVQIQCNAIVVKVVYICCRRLSSGCDRLKPRLKLRLNTKNPGPGVLLPSALAMTHLLPPNLLKLFNARPSLPYIRPVGRSPNKIQPKTVTGVGELLAQIREDMAIADSERDEKNAKRQKDKDTKMKEEGEEGEDDGGTDASDDDKPAFTYVEEVRRQIRREEKQKKRKEAFEKAKESCTLCSRLVLMLAADRILSSRYSKRKQRCPWRPI